ncbi:hypothetical protein J6590_055929 [Homalodisca vitripennis]|nr:hypothetical protein J6590_055929 [Homalodisca vitripennis]
MNSFQNLAARFSYGGNAFRDLVFCRYDKMHYCKWSKLAIHEAMKCPAKLRGCPRWTDEIIFLPYDFTPGKWVPPPSPRDKPPRPEHPPPYLEECWEEGCEDADVECPVPVHVSCDLLTRS